MDLIAHCEPFYVNFIVDDSYPYAYEKCAWCGKEIKYEGKSGYMFCSTGKCASKYWDYLDEYFKIDDGDLVYQKKSDNGDFVFIGKIEKKEEKFDSINFYIPNRRQTAEEVFL